MNSIKREDKAKIISKFILHSPPGEFLEVINDVRSLLKDDTLLTEEVAGAAATYSKEQFIHCQLEGSKEPVLITEHGDLGSNRFFDPRTCQSFKFDHLHKLASDLQPHNPPDKSIESWRLALEMEMTKYVEEQFNKLGATTVYATQQPDQSILLIACIESHQFSPKNFWNGRWRSQWSINFQPNQSTAELQGIMKVQVHYYEDGNVQLVSSKEFSTTLNIGNEETTAKAFKQAVSNAENDYQFALNDNYANMATTTFKALRRILPITRNKIDWNKIVFHRVALELKNSAE